MTVLRLRGEGLYVISQDGSCQSSLITEGKMGFLSSADLPDREDTVSSVPGQDLRVLEICGPHGLSVFQSPGLTL